MNCFRKAPFLVPVADTSDSARLLIRSDSGHNAAIALGELELDEYQVKRFQIRLQRSR
jgi:hypothetical protein